MPSRHVVAYNGNQRPLTDSHGRVIPALGYAAVKADDPVLATDGVAVVPKPDRKAKRDELAAGYLAALEQAEALDTHVPVDEPPAEPVDAPGNTPAPDRTSEDVPQ